MTGSDTIFYISEYFQSIQGEGNYAGANSLFIRFHYCNLTCTWCDTKYSWMGKHDPSKNLTLSALREIIASSPAHHIIFTGGEPAMYPLELLVTGDKKFHVETNGTIIPTQPFETIQKEMVLKRPAMNEDVVSQINWVVSPKLSNSRQQLNPESLRFWADANLGIFKFIVRSIDDLTEVDETVKKYHIDINRVYIGLEGQTTESQMRTDLVEEIIKHGYNFSPRLHVLFWGTQRGK